MQAKSVGFILVTAAKSVNHRNLFIKWHFREKNSP